MYKLLLFEILK